MLFHKEWEHPATVLKDIQNVIVTSHRFMESNQGPGKQSEQVTKPLCVLTDQFPANKLSNRTGDK